jgi:major membrane immunogen (membrane-anchored lipoprotein)
MKTKFFHAFALHLALLICFCDKDTAKTSTGPDDDAQPGRYINGVYEGQTTKDYEGYNAFCTIEVNKGLLSVVDWQIYDNNLKRYFDDTYEEVYTGNPVYMQQCRDNMVGMRAYGPDLIETQDIDKVDCITKATWCWHKFKQVVKITLQDAVADTSASNP